MFPAIRVYVSVLGLKIQAEYESKKVNSRNAVNIVSVESPLLRSDK